MIHGAGKPITSELVLSKLEALRDNRYHYIKMWIGEIRQSSDLEGVQNRLRHLETAVYQCEALDQILYEFYVVMIEGDSGEHDQGKEGSL